MVTCKTQLAESQAELLQANSELNQLLVEHESQCRQYDNQVKKLESEKHDCESRLETATTKNKKLQKQIQDSNEIISELESLIAQSKDQSAESDLNEKVKQLTILLEQKEAELTASVKQLDDLHQSQKEDETIIADVDDDHEKTASLISTAATSSLADDSDQEGVGDEGVDTLNIISQLKAELTSRDEQSQQLRDELEQKVQAVASITETNGQLSSQNVILSESNKTLTANVQQLQEVLHEKDENIRILNEGLTQLQSQYDSQQQTLSTKCSSLINENKTLLADLSKRNKEIDELQNALQQSSDVMVQLRGELADVLESNKSLINSLESDKVATNAQLAKTISELRIAQQQLSQAQKELQFKDSELHNIETQLASQTKDFERTTEELEQLKTSLKITQQQLPQAQELLQLKEDQLRKVENQLASQSEDFKVAKEALEQVKVTTHGMQKNIDKLEAQLAEAKAEIIKCNGEKIKLEMVGESVEGKYMGARV